MNNIGKLYVDVNISFPLGKFIPAVLLWAKFPINWLTKSKLINFKVSNIHD